MQMELDASVLMMPGIGQARGRSLDKLGIRTAGDLLTYFPRHYEDRTKVCPIRDAQPGEPVCIAAMVAEAPRHSRIHKGLELTRAKVVDATAAMTVTFFNQSYVKDALKPGATYIFYGKVDIMGQGAYMSNPVFEPEGRTRFTGCIMPVYPLTAGVSNNLLAALTRRCVDHCAGKMEELLPDEVLHDYELAQCEFSYRNIHFPTSWEALELARRRLIFEEFFYLTCGMALLKGHRDRGMGPVFAYADPGWFCASLPFALTGAQRRVIDEAAADMASGKPMNRLVQGDVGSGKTAVAAACIWLAKQNGCQSAMMAPTEILAQQHFRSLSALLAPAGMAVGLLTGSMKTTEKKKVYAALAAGELDFVVGTHALLSEGVAFLRLGLVVTDEQHRFGVGQRAALSAKAQDTTPHVLVMSATPIPRTLALIVYGDLDLSVIDELPPGRTPIETYLISEDKRQRMYDFVRKLVGEGRQVYIVCPAVEEAAPDTQDGSTGGFANLKAVTAYAVELREKIFPDIQVSFVHGKMKAREKEGVMSAFAAGQISVLVSTTVIEVGVDVPNAALMVVENAERFGLSQLHQLRGRVGRGQHQSYCILMSRTHNEDSRARLKVLRDTADGFKISEEDLKLRGPGDFFGQRQHGLPQLHIADLAGDMRLLKEAQGAAEALLATDPELKKESHQPLLDRVKRLFSDHPDIFN